jgi:hypothetical protein
VVVEAAAADVCALEHVGHADLVVAALSDQRTRGSDDSLMRLLAAVERRPGVIWLGHCASLPAPTDGRSS